MEKNNRSMCRFRFWSGSQKEGQLDWYWMNFFFVLRFRNKNIRLLLSLLSVPVNYCSSILEEILHNFRSSCEKFSWKLITSVLFRIVFTRIFSLDWFFVSALRNSVVNTVPYCRFEVSASRCGSSTEGTFDGDADSSFQNTVIFQNDPLFLEMWDTVRVLRCTWRQNYVKNIRSKPFQVYDDMTVSRGPGAPCWTKGTIKVLRTIFFIYIYCSPLPRCRFHSTATP